MPLIALRKKLHIQLKRYPVPAALLLCVMCLLLLRCGGKGYPEFLDDLGMRESSDNYAAVNQYGYLGRYQLGDMALQDAGFLDQWGHWTELAASYDIDCREDFLASPKGQDAAAEAYHRKLCGYIRFYGLDAYLGTTYCGVKVTQSGLLAACHLVGFKAMSGALATGEPVYDGNNVPASEYLELFAGYNIRKVWKEQES